ncbi:type IV secretory system conjugative DNA transfer family protein [Mycolicibacterium sp. S3B2]|uniref:type IV secretory system conjugative DNA transfer family protein n=1 Tax=Mycolicibacterium sp. S3B2 TaxID=3415120 RepID=UPI003C7E9C35
MDLIIISVALPVLSLSAWGIYSMSKQAQHNLDASRRSYTVTFPTGMTEKNIQAFIKSIGSDLIPNKDDRGGIPTLVTEVRWTSKGLRHILRVTPQDDAHVKLMLDAHIPGITWDPIDTAEESLDMVPTFSVEVAMTDHTHMLRIPIPEELSRGILHSVPALNDGEHVAYQLVMSHTENIKLPNASKKASSSLLKTLVLGPTEPDAEEVKEVKQKIVEQNFNVTIRVAVQAANEPRARELAGGLLRTLRQANSNTVQFNGRVMHGNTQDTINLALTPRKKSAQLTVTELSALMAAPIGDPQVPGLTQGAARRLPATEAISSDGEWLLGYSDVHGREKKITLPKEFVSQHASVIGASGSGKTVFLANGVAQYADAGLGIFVIDAGQDVSTQRLFYRALDAMPYRRREDVICINPADDPDNPVSINLLDQDFGMGAIDIVVGVFESLYPDISKGVSVRELLHHGLWTLIEAGGYTLIDLASLLSPRNQAEFAWATHIIKQVGDPELKDFWSRNPGALKSPGDRGRTDWDKYVEPIHRRLWQLVSRPEIRYLLGQTKSTIKIKDVLEQNKILLFSVGGMNDAGAAQLLASLTTQMAWTAAQSVQPKKPNVMFLDEFQVSTRIQGGLPDMLARARALNLGLVLSTQYVTRETIPRELQSAVLNNTSTKIVFRSANNEADAWSREFGRQVVTSNDITRLERFHAVAKVANQVGDQSPVTFRALRPAPDTEISNVILQNSRQKYGHHIAHVRQEIMQRRRVSDVAPKAPVKKNIGTSTYEPEGQRS